MRSVEGVVVGKQIVVAGGAAGERSAPGKSVITTTMSLFENLDNFDSKCSL